MKAAVCPRALIHPPIQLAGAALPHGRRLHLGLDFCAEHPIARCRRVTGQRFLLLLHFLLQLFALGFDFLHLRLDLFFFLFQLLIFYSQLFIYLHQLLLIFLSDC